MDGQTPKKTGAWRSGLAFWLGRFALSFSRLIRRGGTNWPGRLARQVDPEILARLAPLVEHGHVVITGTNGKTTTARMVATAMTAGERVVVHNRAGANLHSGLVTALIAGLGRMRPRAAWGILEVDEATVPGVAPLVVPRWMVVTNFFRDQLDRYGELSTTVRMVAQGAQHLAPGGALVLNADDPLVASIGLQSTAQVVYFGIAEAADVPTTHEVGHVDLVGCPVCGEELQYRRRYYAHVGDYRCTRCSFTRPSPQVALTGIAAVEGGQRLDFVLPDGGFSSELAVPGLYNAYNALAAVAAGWAGGLPTDALRGGLERFQPSFGRLERFRVGSQQVTLALIKNPTGFNQVLSTIRSEAVDSTLLFVINDRAADGRDVSWLWDVNLEQLPGQGFRTLLTSGDRAEDMALRLRYAGFEASFVRSLSEPALALDAALKTGSPSVWVLPTYTALLEIRDLLRKGGHLPSHWQQ